MKNARAFGVGIWTLVGQLAATTASAQAWVPAKGEGTLTLTYQNYYFTGHLDPEGHTDHNGATHAKTLLADVDYGLTNSLALSVSLPFVASKYTGSPAGLTFGPLVLPAGPLDNGRYHAAFQDWQFGLRYEARGLPGAIAVTPFFGATIPSHRYETSGEAVPGKHRREALLGVNAGVPLDSIVRGAYVHARYSYGIVERVRGARLNSSNVDIEAGTAILPRLTLRGLSAWHIAHDHFLDFQAALQDPELWRIHDREVGASFVNAGGGLTISLTPAVDLNALYVTTVSGGAGAHAATSLSFGMSWSFGGGYGAIFGSN